MTHHSFKEQDSKGDVIIFQNFYVRILSRQSSFFSILVQPEEKFRLLIPFEPEICQVFKDKESFFYFQVEDPSVFSSLKIELKISKQTN